MNIRVSALIPAAGSGERLAMGPKAFVKLRGLTLLERAIDAFAGLVNEIIVALPPSHINTALPAGVLRVLGGSSRQMSVQNLIQAASGDVVLIHDAARPFLMPEIIQATLSAVLECNAATVALPASDTLVFQQIGTCEPDAHPKLWGSLLDRSQIHAIQTPQGFRRELILQAHNAAINQGIEATDDAGLVSRLGLPVAFVPGDPRLFKITRPGDYALAEAFAGVWDAQRDNKKERRAHEA